MTHLAAVADETSVDHVSAAIDGTAIIHGPAVTCAVVENERPIRRTLGMCRSPFSAAR